MKESDVDLAVRLATEAGALLLTARAESQLSGKAGDAAANAFLMVALRAARPGDAILSEEEKPDGHSAHRMWIIDPLDGSREYGEGRTDWAVHVALAIDGEPAVGAVALPGLGLTLSSGTPHPAVACNAPLRMLVSRTRPAAEAVAVAELLAADLHPMGSAGAKAMAVVRGAADIYLHTGGQYAWDNCAPAAVALAAGLHVSRVDGSPLRYDSADPWLPDLLICRKDDAARILAILVNLGACAPSRAPG
jgi:3'(2'), 5'-bisphosphate nucleotidase